MPAEIAVGPPVLTINQGSTFMVADQNGEIAADSEQGVFAHDTRFVSYYAISANGEPWLRLTSSPTSYYSAQIYLTNRTIPTEEGDIPEGTLGLRITRSVGEGIHEDLDVTNHSLKPVLFNLEVALRSDFADLFEVKGHRFVRRGRIETDWDAEKAELQVCYNNKDFHRRLIYRPDESSSRPRYANGRVTFEVELEPGASWHTCCYYILETQDRIQSPLYGCTPLEGGTKLDELQAQWQRVATKLTSANEDIYRFYRQSVDDMGALRLYDHDFSPDVWLPAAGVPWFVTV